MKQNHPRLFKSREAIFFKNKPATQQVNESNLLLTTYCLNLSTVATKKAKTEAS
ncbi:hypothetical protein RV14_GL000342 [Enterococcus ratti]|uniref:Uncharacterized protein n=1 Tax=Enterococcus ratti TaxID=150033 RepID=A0A1L8WJJ0_9ENTE|nr:hypothetical protein RV14_GL000342 [Enterococcus ratti]